MKFMMTVCAKNDFIFAPLFSEHVLTIIFLWYFTGTLHLNSIIL